MIAYLFVIAGIISIIAFITYLCSKEKEPFEAISNIIFMQFEETEKFLLDDRDRYVSNFSYYDLYARKVKDTREYLEVSSKLAMSFSPEEKALLQKCAILADEFFRSVDFSKTDYYAGLKGRDIANIQWVFALTTKLDGKEYEEGFPHTREHIIFVSKQVLLYNEADLTNTLIHEKIHIYQRFNPNIFKKVLVAMKYGIIDKSQVSNAKLIRANPDLDGNIYYDKSNNKEVVCLYKSEQPTGINDVKFSNFVSEHPYEKIAYDIAGMYYKTHIDKYKDI